MKNKTMTFLLCSCVFLAPAVGAGVSKAADATAPAAEISQGAKSVDRSVRSDLEQVSDNTQDANAAKLRAMAPLKRADGSIVSTSGAVINSDGSVTYADGTVRYLDGTVKYADGTTMDASGVFHQADGSIMKNTRRAEYADGRQTASEYLDDTGITAKVKEEFLTQKGLDSLDLHVKTMDGVVTLTGEVDNSSQISLAENVAQKVKGVRNVDNKLMLKKGERTAENRANDGTDANNRDKGQTVGEYMDDAGITASVKAKFLAQKGLDSLDISVETMDGTVTLTGAVDNAAQSGLAESVAHEVDGVKNVVNKLSVKQ